MTVAVYVPLLLALLLAVIARRIAARGNPAFAARGLVCAALIAAASSTWSLTLLALTLLDDLPPLVTLDEYPTLELPEPVPGPVALVAALALLWGAARLAMDLRLRIGTHRRLRAAGDPRAGLAVADWQAPLAVAIPGRPGHLLVTTGMLRLLDDEERRVVFAHERAHLAHHHHRLAAWAGVAAAVNPLLTPVRDAVGYLIERWADEDAAVAVGDRDLVAQTVARAALATGTAPVDGTDPTAGSAGASTVLGVHGAVLVHRVRALLQPAPAPGRRRLLGPALLSVLLVAATAVATVEFVRLARTWLAWL